MTRPRGTIRQALASSAWEIARASPLGGATWREAASLAQVGFSAACRTWHRMREAGELVDVGTVQTEQSCRPMVLCAPAGAAATESAAAACDALMGAMRSWSEFR